MFGRSRKREDTPVQTAATPEDVGTTRPIRSVGLDLDERGQETEETAAVPAYAGRGEPEERGSESASYEPVAPSFGPPSQATQATRSTRDVEREPDPAPEAEPTPEAERAPEPEPVTQPVPVAAAEEPRPPVATEVEPAAAPDLSAEERTRRARSGRAPDDRPDPRKPSVWRAARSAFREFGRDQCTDLAAALTYYSVLSIFPAALALLSLLGLVSDPTTYVAKVTRVLEPLVSGDTVNRVEDQLDALAGSNVAGIALVVGLVVALFSASAYVGAFGRAMNRILEVEEGRPVWKLRPSQILVTLVTVLLTAVALVILVVSGPVAASVGSVLGLQDTVVTVWGYAKWPVLALIVIAVVGVLYRSTPNAKQEFRWLSPGAFVAIVVWLVASAGLAFYVANVNDYDRTFGSVAGVVVALLWLWLTNLALLFGAELDSELERNRQLQAGTLAEVSLQLPLRDDRTIRSRAAKQEKVVAGHRAVRESFLGGGQVEDRPYR